MAMLVCCYKRDRMREENTEMFSLAPVATTVAGSCLTMANWQALGVKALSYYLDDLIMKPGLAFFMKHPQLKRYLGWSEKLILQINLKPNKTGNYSLRSPYDGSTLQIDSGKLCALIMNLEPDCLVLSTIHLLKERALWEALSPSTLVFIPPTAELPNLLFPDRQFGSFLFYNREASLFKDFIQQLLTISQPLYVAGEFSLEELNELRSYKITYLETDTPASDAIAGKIYYKNRRLNLLDSDMATQAEVIDKDCQCPSCKQMFTRAYLHHLFLHTPLLCQRLLIQHNIHTLC